MTKTGWDMTDEELDKTIIECHEGWHAYGDKRNNTRGFAAAIRALFPRPAPPPAGDVPSVEEVELEMGKVIHHTQPDLAPGSIRKVCARVAHDLLLKHARPRMLIDGMTAKELFDAYFHSPEYKPGTGMPSFAFAEFVHRLATTPTPGATVSEILRLRAELAAARGEALEEAAVLMETEHDEAMLAEMPGPVRRVRAHGQKSRASRIRALKGPRHGDAEARAAAVAKIMDVYCPHLDPHAPFDRELAVEAASAFVLELEQRGYKVVGPDATEEMLWEWASAYANSDAQTAPETRREAYRAMHKAAPRWGDGG